MEELERNQTTGALILMASLLAMAMSLAACWIWTSKSLVSGEAQLVLANCIRVLRFSVMSAILVFCRKNGKDLGIAFELPETVRFLAVCCLCAVAAVAPLHHQFIITCAMRTLADCSKLRSSQHAA